jgi:HTH-type transcriptional regulator / antitoxin HigA
MLNTTKINGKMTLTFNKTTYGHLLTEFVPKIIETEEEYEQALQVFEPLFFKKNRTPEERAFYLLLRMLIESYEEEHYSAPASPPHKILQHILESSGMRQTDLVALGLGSSGVVSEIVNGKRAISKAQAKILADRFKVSPSLFI